MIVHKALVQISVDESIETPSSVEYRKDYYSDVDNSWHLAGSGDVDDPGGAKSIVLSRSGDSPISNYGIWSGYCEETATYRLVGTFTAGDSILANGVSLNTTDKIAEITLNSSHRQASSGVHGVTGSVVGTTDAQVIRDKTLVSPEITTPSGLTKDDVFLSNVDNYNAEGMVSSGLTSAMITAVAGGVDVSSFADSSNMLASADEIVAALAEGSNSNSMSVLKYISSQILSNTKVLDQLMYSGFVTYGEGSPSSLSITPVKIGAIFVDILNSKVYASKATSGPSDWLILN